MDTDSDGQISVAELIAWVKKNSEQVRHVKMLIHHVAVVGGKIGTSVSVLSGLVPRGRRCPVPSPNYVVGSVLLQCCGNCSSCNICVPPLLPACLELHTYTTAGTRGSVQRDLLSSRHRDPCNTGGADETEAETESAIDGGIRRSSAVSTGARSPIAPHKSLLCHCLFFEGARPRRVVVDLTRWLPSGSGCC